MHREGGREVEAVVPRESGWLIAVRYFGRCAGLGIRAWRSIAVSSNGIYAPTTIPASAMSKVHYFRVARHPDMIPNALRMLIVSQ